VPTGLDEATTRKWEAVKMWKTAIKKNIMLDPGEMNGVDGIRDILRFQALLCPYQLMSEYSLKQMDEQRRVEVRGQTERELVQWLEKYGF
jgi:hypothetical protein